MKMNKIFTVILSLALLPACLGAGTAAADEKN